MLKLRFLMFSLAFSFIGLLITTSKVVSSEPEWLNIPYFGVVQSFIDLGDTVLIGTNAGWTHCFDKLTQTRQLSQIKLGGVMSFLKDKNGNIWISNGSEVYIYNSKSLKEVKYKDKSIRGFEMNLDSNNNIWITNYETGIIKFDLKDTIQYTVKNDFQISNYTHIISDKEGTVWLNSKGKVFQFINNEWINFSEKIFELSGKYVTTVALDNFGDIWFGSLNGLIKYDKINWTFYTPENSEVPIKIIVDIVIDKKNNLWFSGNQADKTGLGSYDGINFKHYTVSNSKLADNSIQKLYCDGNSNIWMGLGSNVNSISVFKEGGIDFTSVLESFKPITNELVQIQNNLISVTNNDNQVQNLTIYSILGEEILKTSSFESNIDLNFLNDGLYLIQVKTKQDKQIYKFIKN